LSDIPVLYLRLRWGFVGLSRRDLFTLVASGDISPSRVSPDFSGTCRLFCRNKGAFFCHCRDLFFSIVFLRLRHPLFGLPALYPFISGFMRSAPFCEVFSEPSRRSGLCLLSLTFCVWDFLTLVVFTRSTPFREVFSEPSRRWGFLPFVFDFLRLGLLTLVVLRGLLPSVKFSANLHEGWVFALGLDFCV
jgi:hypothetical protein